MTKDDFISKYREYRKTHGVVPKYRTFLSFSGSHARQLTNSFGRDAYSRLQKECGDNPNRLDLERTPIEKIMRQYGDLALELGMLPLSSDWSFRQLRPSIAGLGKRPHFIKWSDFPTKFSEWIEAEKISGYDHVLNYAKLSAEKCGTRTDVTDSGFERFVGHVRLWSPARRRNSEGEYKIELRGHLKERAWRVNEEFGESNFDLFVDEKYAVEIKKDPKLGEYDRLFGQLARHLQHQRRVVAVIMDAPSQDNFENFALLVDRYLNQSERVVEIVKK